MTWTGMNRNLGRVCTDTDHLAQSITDIILTPKGTRVMRRTYGSEVFALLDAPLNGATRMRVMAATVEAILQWEPRVRVVSLAMSVAFSGQLVLQVTFERQDGARTRDTVAVDLGVRP